MDNLYINSRYINSADNKWPKYICYNGVLKRYIPSLITKRIVNEDNVYYAMKDLPEFWQEKLRDMAVTPEELSHLKKSKAGNIIDNEGVIIFVNGNTLLVPIVGNFLPEDGIDAYTVVMNGDKPSLKPILVCFNCHWSDLFTGNTVYGDNVFCLLSDLPLDIQQRMANQTIALKNVSEFLGLSRGR